MEGATGTIPKPTTSSSSAGPDQMDIEAGLNNKSTSSDFRTMLADQQPSQGNLCGSDKGRMDHTNAGNDDGSAATEKHNPAAQVPNNKNTTGNDSSGNINTTSIRTANSQEPLSAKDSSRPKDSPKKSTKASLQNKLMHLREHNDKKVVGLKNYGVSKSTRNVRKNEWLSSTRSMQSHPELTTTTANNNNNNNNNNTSNQVVELRDISPPIPDVIPSTTDHPGMYMYPGGGAEGPPGPGQPPHHAKDGLLVEDPAAPAPPSYMRPPKMPKSVEELEEKARRKAILNPFELLFLGNLAALKVMGFYLITLETVISCGLTTGLTMYWYEANKNNSSWNGGGLDFVLLAFAVTAPISAAIGMAFQRRERALIAIADFRSFSYHLYMAHCLWDWDGDGKQKAVEKQSVNWLEHTDAVLAQLLGIGDELARFLTLPTSSRSRHRMTRQGRKEAARTMEVAYMLVESMTAQRMTRLVYYSERLKKIGLPSGEISRVRQYERFISDILEQLRMVKLYRTPQALRSFGRIFTVFLPPFYAPVFAQVARETQSLAVGVLFGIITALALTALFESMQILEDPFTAFLALDGVDAREEFEVLHFAQMTATRRLVFPEAPEYPAGRRAALTRWNHPGMKHTIGTPPVQPFHVMGSAGSVRSGVTFEEVDHGTGETEHPPSRIDPEQTEHADVELGTVLPTSEIYSPGRVSAFDEDRAFFGEDEDESRHVLRHRRRTSSFSRATSPSGDRPPSHKPPSTHTPPPPSRDGSVVNLPRPNPQHRRNRTNLSMAGLISQTSKMRLPDC